MRGKRNPRWQAYYDSLWYFYWTEVTPTGEVRRKHTRSGVEAARQTAKALTYHPEIVSLVLYSSKKSRKAGRAERYLWTREKGWH